MVVPFTRSGKALNMIRFQKSVIMFLIIEALDNNNCKWLLFCYGVLSVFDCLDQLSPCHDLSKPKGKWTLFVHA